MRLSIVIYSNLRPIFHRLATI